MSTPQDGDSDALLETRMLRINRLCNEFEADWRLGRPRQLEDVLSGLTGADWQAALRDLLPLEIEYRQRAGQTVGLADYSDRFPNADRQWLASLFGSTGTATDTHGTAFPVPERLGDYQIIGRIGGGGMGTVYKALHVRMGRVVALKVLRTEIQQNPVLLQRFDREVRAAARLTHPNIVAALDAREHDGLHYLITEFIDGLDLDIIVKNSGPLPVATAVDCVLQAARGLDYAHGKGVVHRDIKPANLLRDSQGVVKVLDMGLARLDADAGTPTATDLTNSGMVLGTAAYMSPEQARDVRRADARSDLYSLGCTLFYLLTGRHAFTGASPLDTVLLHLSEPAPSLSAANPATPVALEQIFSRMVAKEPGDRFQSAAELVSALEELPLNTQMDPISTIDSDSRVNEFVLPTLAITAPANKLTRPPTSFFPRSYTGRLRLFVAVSIVFLLINVAIVARSMFRKPDAVPKPSPVVGRFALSFDGTSSYVAVPGLAPREGATYTLEALVEPAIDRRSNVISWLGPDWMALYLSEGSWGLARRVRGESHLILAAEKITLNKRVHVAGVFHGADLQLFVDGKPVEAGPSTFLLPETKGGLFIGGVDPAKLPEDQNDRFFGGRIHAVRITDGIRYAAPFQIPKSLVSDPQTLALFRFHSGKGSVVKDESSEGHDAEIHNARWIMNAP